MRITISTETYYLVKRQIHSGVCSESSKVGWIVLDEDDVAGRLRVFELVEFVNALLKGRFKLFAFVSKEVREGAELLRFNLFLLNPVVILRQNCEKVKLE
jgi:hypothetical protein